MIAVLPRKPNAFTLIELLVVVTIIALLIAILLPALGLAKERANAVKCSANMKGVSAAILMYTQTNDGRFPIGQVDKGASSKYPGGWFWAARLESAGYLTAVNRRNTSSGQLQNNGFLFCPKGILQNTSGSGTYPTDPLNQGYLAADDETLPANTQVITWYNVTTKVPSKGGGLGTGSSSTPFMTFQDDSKWNDPNYQRTLPMVRQPARLVMMIECATNNFDNTASGAALPPPDSGNFKFPRIAGRHPPTQTSGKDATTNISFFDGHVAPYATRKFSLGGINAYGADVNFFFQSQ